MAEQKSKLAIERSHPSPSGFHAAVSLPKELQTRTAKELAALTPLKPSEHCSAYVTVTMTQFRKLDILLRQPMKLAAF
ncbi:hypothetical protein N7493_008707 [Penicillium malachiteum]|uniref:Uncharacterized protein n=1 Tax=Penicillium malachiteum TaxID=1324776 RepID=A0AAD6HFI5_9EURO|nr:hypothetical protein N7493_008707 [Penicillium malachiteum]